MKSEVNLLVASGATVRYRVGHEAWSFFYDSTRTLVLRSERASAFSPAVTVSIDHLSSTAFDAADFLILVRDDGACWLVTLMTALLRRPA